MEIINLKDEIKKTPEAVKQLFAPFLFPCQQDKSPFLQHGQTWQFESKNKEVVRSIGGALSGLDCEQAGLVVVDVDAYKKEYKDSKEAKNFVKQCLKISRFKYLTPRGGLHIYFKGKIKSIDPFPGVEIKSIGKYVAMYGHPAPLGDYDTWESFYNDLPEFNFDLGKKNQSVWKKGTRNNNLNKKCFEGAKDGDRLKIDKAIFEAGKSGLTWEETEKTAQSGIKSGGGMPAVNKLNTAKKQTTKRPLVGFKPVAQPRKWLLMKKYLSKPDLISLLVTPELEKAPLPVNTHIDIGKRAG